MAKTLVISGANFTTNKLDTVSFSERIPCTALSLSESTLSMTALSETYTITATPTPANTTDSVTWTSSNTTVVTVANGVITSIGEGSATITAACGDQSATCTVSVVVPIDYVLVAGYGPYRRGTGNHAATLGKKTDAVLGYHVLAANNISSSVYPIESKPDVDTGNWRFVPIVIPTGVTGITITSTHEMKTMMLWFDKTKVDDVTGLGAWVVDGHASEQGWDQANWSTTISLSVPSSPGINSFGGCVYFRDGTSTNGTDYSNEITVTFVTD